MHSSGIDDPIGSDSSTTGQITGNGSGVIGNKELATDRIDGDLATMGYTIFWECITHGKGAEGLMFDWNDVRRPNAAETIAHI